MDLSVIADDWLLVSGVFFGIGLTFLVLSFIQSRRLARSRSALRASQRRLDLASEAAGVGAWEWHFKRDEIWVTDQTRILYGFGSKERINFNRFLSALHVEDRDAVRAAVVQSLEDGARFQREYRIALADGRVNWVVTRGRVEAGFAGRSAVMRGISLDISERKRREDELHQERAFLRQVIDMNPNLIFTKDRQGRFTLANQVVADIYGTTVDDLIGKTDADFNSNSEEVQWFHQKDMEVLDTLQPQLTPEERVTDATGKVHWLETLKLPVMNVDGTANQLLGTAIDITERKQVELDLAQQRNELAHLSRVMMLSELSGSLAHELNQPLMAILSNAQAALRFLAQDNPDLNEIREILRDIVGDDKRAGEVIQGLRLLLKKGEMRREPIDPSELVQSVFGLLRSDLLNSGTDVAIQLAPALPMIKGDRVQLQQVLINLVVNSCDAMTGMETASRRLLISVDQQSGDCVRIGVSDHGHGIAQDALERVFESFFTTKAHGLGLGLAVCRKIIEAHGGRMWAINNPGGGACFHFTVPVFKGK